MDMLVLAISSPQVFILLSVGCCVVCHKFSSFSAHLNEVKDVSVFMGQRVSVISKIRWITQVEILFPCLQMLSVSRL